MDRLLFCCRLTEKAYTLGHRVFIRTHDPAETSIVDDMLWTFRQGSFVPHGGRQSKEATPPPVLVDHRYDEQDEFELLINLSEELPPTGQQFERIAEIINQDAALKQQGRAHYRQYQQQDYEVQHHQMK